MYHGTSWEFFWKARNILDPNRDDEYLYDNSRTLCNYIELGLENGYCSMILDRAPFLDRWNDTMLFTTTSRRFGLALGGCVNPNDTIAIVHGLNRSAILRHHTMGNRLITDSLAAEPYPLYYNRTAEVEFKIIWIDNVTKINV
jgi:hypothetical protein